MIIPKMSTPIHTIDLLELDTNELNQKDKKPQRTLTKNLVKSNPSKTNQQIKSRDRVRDLAEVYTNKREVGNMLDLIKVASYNSKTTFLEPACGNGNFLVEILDRKLMDLHSIFKSRRLPTQEKLEFEILNTVRTIYGIDIMTDNVVEARERLTYRIKEFLSNNYGSLKISQEFWQSLGWILTQNIVVGDSLNNANNIVFWEYATPKIDQFNLKQFYLVPRNKELEGMFNEPTTLIRFNLIKYTELSTLLT